MNTLLKTSLLASVCAVVMGFASTASGQMIYIDLGVSGSLQPSPDSNSNYWNYITGTSYFANNLVTTGNVGTTINATFTGVGGGGTNTWNSGLNAVSTLGPNANSAWAFQPVTNDGLFWTATDTPTLTLSGLDNTKTYNLYFFGSRTSASDRFTRITIGATTLEMQTSGAALTNQWNSDTVLKFSSLSPGSNQISAALTAFTQAGGAGSSTFGYINAMGIEVIPEPATWALLAGSLTVLTIFRRRRM